jgi:hypothetical protein
MLPGVEVKLCASMDAADEIFILCKSKDRALKEQAMHDRFVGRIEKGLEKLNRTCEQRQGKNITQLIERRVGRLLHSNSRGAALFDITVSFDVALGRTAIAVDKNDGASQ